MALRSFFNWFVFGVYLVFCAALPLTVLWGEAGLWIGAALALFFLASLGWRASERIAHRLHARRLSVSEAPEVFAQVKEYCRRLALPPPTLWIIESEALNMGGFGFSRRRAHLVLTRGLLEGVGRQQLGALIGRQLTGFWHRETWCESWLSQFFAVLEGWLQPAPPRKGSLGRRFYPFRIFLRQVLLYPLTLFPAFILEGGRDEKILDLKSVRLTQQPKALAESMRAMEAYRERRPLSVPFSTRHLFLLPPMTQDPLARLFFASFDLHARIGAVEDLSQVVARA